MISNVPGPVARQYLAGAELETMYPFAVLSHGTRLFIASLTASGQMGIGFVEDRASLPHLQHLPIYTRDAFDELEAGVGIPSQPRSRARGRV